MPPLFAATSSFLVKVVPSFPAESEEHLHRINSPIPSKCRPRTVSRFADDFWRSWTYGFRDVSCPVHFISISETGDGATFVVFVSEIGGKQPRLRKCFLFVERWKRTPPRFSEGMKWSDVYARTQSGRPRFWVITRLLSLFNGRVMDCGNAARVKFLTRPLSRFRPSTFSPSEKRKLT